MNQHVDSRKPNDLTGRIFGKLTVRGLSDKRGPRGKRTVPLWECVCECGAVTYKAGDTLKNPSVSMCADCARKYSAAIARRSAGYVDGTQITRIRNMTPTAASRSGVRGVVYEESSHRWRARLYFKDRYLSFGSYTRFEDAVAARKAAEKEYFGKFLEEYDTHKLAQ